MKQQYNKPASDSKMNTSTKNWMDGASVWSKAKALGDAHSMQVCLQTRYVESRLKQFAVR